MNDPNATKSGNCEKVRGKIVSKTGRDVLDEARRLLSTAVAGVPADGWNRPTPCAEWDVTQVLQHAALDQRVWGATLAGTEMPGENPFAPSGQPHS